MRSTPEFSRQELRYTLQLYPVVRIHEERYDLLTSRDARLPLIYEQHPITNLLNVPGSPLVVSARLAKDPWTDSERA